MAQKVPLDRLTASAQLAIFQARVAVSEHGGRALNDVHLLLGLLRAAPELGPLLRPSVNFQQLSECLVGSLGPPFLPAGGEVPYDPSADAILQEGVKVAGALGQSAVTPTHLFIALLRQPTTVAGRCLQSVGLDLAATTAAAEKYARDGQ